MWNVIRDEKCDVVSPTNCLYAALGQGQYQILQRSMDKHRCVYCFCRDATTQKMLGEKQHLISPLGDEDGKGFVTSNKLNY